jgi:hypothetical protein
MRCWRLGRRASRRARIAGLAEPTNQTGAMRFAFKEIRDGRGYYAIRPVFHFGLNSPDSPPGYCLLDTGSPDTFVCRKLAEEAGINLDGAEEIGEFDLEGETCTGRKAHVDCVITNGSETIELPNIPVIFPSSRPADRQFAAVFGTINMARLRITVCAKDGWLEIAREV